MFRITALWCMFLALACSVVPLAAFAQQAAAGGGNQIVPMLVNFSGVLTGANGKSLTGTVGVTFSLYQGQEGGAPLWLETQNVQVDKTGHYSVQLGAASSQGLPPSVFAAGEARWLGVQPQGQEEQPRTLLMSVPYALKALDAETIGGRPASSFMLAPAAGKAGASSPNSPAANITGSGTADFIPKFTGTTTVGNSKIYQNASNQVGINTTSPAATLDVKGTSDVRDTLTLFPKSSHPTLSVSGTAFQVASTGKVTFVSGQTFPGTGTVTQVNSGAGLTGGPITGSGTLSVPNAGITNAMLQNSSLTVNTSSPLTGGGSISLGGSKSLGLQSCSSNQILEYNGSAWACVNIPAGTVNNVAAGTDIIVNNPGGPTATVNVDTTKVPQLAAVNSFTNNNSFSGTVGIGTTAPSHLLEVDANTNQAQIAMVSTGTDAAISLNNTNTGNGGREYWIDSGSLGAGVGSGNFAVWDNTAGAMRVVVDASGAFGVGGFPSGDAQVEIDSSPFRIWALVGTGYSAPFGSGDDGDDGVYGYGGFGDLSTGGTFGGWGVFGVGGEGTESDGMGGLFAGGSFSSGGDGIYSNAGTGYAGNFRGDLNVTGAIFAGVKDFKIDHPLDPANKYLVHASVESSEMKNIYDGVVTTDQNGEATVLLPDWFEALNTSFRYQLTVIGQFAQAIVAREIQNHEFAIRTNAPNVKVSWQVTGVRQDAFAKANPLVVEEEKEARLKGYYIHPEFYGAPAEKQLEWARNPRAMKTLAERNQVREKQQMKEMQQKKVRPAAQVRPAALAQSTHLVK